MYHHTVNTGLIVFRILRSSLKGTALNLLIIALALLGGFVVAYAIIYALICDDSVTLPVRILSLIIIIGGYAGIIALTMLLLGIPIS